MTNIINKEKSLELLNLLQEVKTQIETNSNTKITIRNNAKRTKVFAKIQGNGNTKKYLFTFKNGWTLTYLISRGNWKKPKGRFESQLILCATNSKTIEFLKNTVK